MKFAIKAAIAVPVLALLPVVGIQSSGSTHVPDHSKSCQGVVGSMSSAPSSNTSTITVVVGSAPPVTDTFDGNGAVSAPVPQDGVAYDWSVNIDSENNTFDRFWSSAEEGKVGPCGEAPPPPPVRVFKAKTRIIKDDNCSCVKDHLYVKYNRDKVRVTIDRVSHLRWKVTAIGRVAPNDTRFLLPNRWNGSRGWAQKQVYRFKFKDQSCGPYTGEHQHWVATHNPCRSKRGC